MIRIGACLAALAAVCAAAAECRAEVVVQTPVGAFVFGRPAPRCAPGVDVQVGPFAGVHVRPAPYVPTGGVPVLPPPAPLPPQPVPDGLPVLPPPQPLVVTPAVPTMEQFAATFKPCPGTYEAFIIHPKSGEPVKVTFSLPEGTPCKVKVKRREIDFDYGKHSVSIRFRINGSVSVSTN